MTFKEIMEKVFNEPNGTSEPTDKATCESLHLTDADIGKKFRTRGGKVVTLEKWHGSSYKYRTESPFSGYNEHGICEWSQSETPGINSRDLVSRVDDVPTDEVAACCRGVETLNQGERVRILALEWLARNLNDLCEEVANKVGVSNEAVRPTVGLAMTEYGISGMFQCAADWPTEKAAEFSSAVADAFGKMALGHGDTLVIEIPKN